MKLIQNSCFQDSGYVFFNNYIEKNQNKTHFEEGMCMRGEGVKGRLEFFQKLI